MSNSSKISENNSTVDIYNLEPNQLIAMTFNFDVLKYVITELINNQKNSFDEILQIKTEVLENKKNIHEIESALIEMKISSNMSSKIKSQLEEEKQNLINKKAELEKEIENLKDSENQSKMLIMNMKKTEVSISEKKPQEKEQKKEPLIETNQIKKESQKNVKIDKVKDDKIKNDKVKDDKVKDDKIKKDKVKDDKMKDDKVKDDKVNDEKFKDDKVKDDKVKEEKVKDEKVKKDDKIKDKVASDLFRQVGLISNEMKNIKNKNLYLEKDFIEYKNSIDDQLSKKIELYLPKLEKRILSQFEYIKNTLIQNISKNTENITEIKDKYYKTLSDINENISDLREKEDKDSMAIYELKTTSNLLTTKVKTITESLPTYTKLTDFRQYKNDTADMLAEDKRELTNSISSTKSTFNILKNQFLDHINDSTDHNHIQFLLKKYENAQNRLYKLEEFQQTMEEIEKRRIIVDPSKYVKIDSFNEFTNAIHKNLDSKKKELTEIRNYLDEIRQKEILKKASFKDLKLLEDSLLMRFGDLQKIISENYVDKITLNKSTKSIELQTKQMIEENKKNDKADNWLLAKKAITGHLCASCESEIADLNQDSNKFIFWNRILPKDQSEKKFKIDGGISKILKMIKNNNADINDNNERYVTNDIDESNEKGRNEKKGINLLNKSNNDGDNSKNLPKIAMKLRKNNSSMTLINADVNIKNTTNISANKNISKNLSKDYVGLNDESKIQLKEDVYDNVIGPKITKIYKKH